MPKQTKFEYTKEWMGDYANSLGLNINEDAYTAIAVTSKHSFEMFQKLITYHEAQGEAIPPMFDTLQTMAKEYFFDMVQVKFL